MRVLVTGGAGFIGSHLVERLVRGEHDVLVLDNLSTGTMDNLGDIDVRGTLVGDIRDRGVCRDAVADCEAVFHLAALGSVPRSVEDPFTTHEVNVTGTLNLLEAARQAGVKRFIYASSSSVYGVGQSARKLESQGTHPLSPYGVSKLAAEHYCHVYRGLHGLATTALRYFNVFGPRQNPAGPYAAVVPRFVQACLRGEPMVIFGDGKQTRDFTYVENVVEANMLALKKTPEGPYNVGCGEGTTVGMLALRIAEACGQWLGDKATIEYAEARPGDVRGSEAAITRAMVSLKYRPQVGVVEGIQRTVEWFKAQEK